MKANELQQAGHRDVIAPIHAKLLALGIRGESQTQAWLKCLSGKDS